MVKRPARHLQQLAHGLLDICRVSSPELVRQSDVRLFEALMDEEE
jgi:hypothetical protein